MARPAREEGSIRARDTALARVPAVTRWVAVGGVAAVGATSAAAAVSVPGHTARHPQSPPAPTRTVPAPIRPSVHRNETSSGEHAETNSNQHIQRPSQPPAPAPQAPAPAATSGGS